MTADDRALSRYLSATRHLKPVDETNTLSKCVSMIADEMRSQFKVGERFGERVRFLQVDSVQAECEMYQSTLIVDLNFVRLMLEIALLTQTEVKEETLLCLAADRLAESYLACGEYESALALREMADSWRPEKQALTAHQLEMEFLLMQIHFLVIHESFHWVFCNHADLERGAMEMFEQQLRPAVAHHADILLSPEHINWNIVTPFRVEETVSYLNAMRGELLVWFDKGREELTCDYWAIDGLIGPLRDPTVVGQALLAASALHAALGYRDTLQNIAAGRDMSGSVRRGFLGSASAAARFTIFRGLCEAVCTTRNKTFDRGSLERGYRLHLAVADRLIAIAQRLISLINQPEAQEETKGTSLASPPSTLREKALESLGYRKG